MNIECVVSDCLVLNSEDKQSDDGRIHWSELVFMQGTNVNTVTVDSKVKKELTIGQKYDLLFTVTEQTKAKNNVAYKVNKFKCTGYFEPVSE